MACQQGLDESPERVAEGEVSCPDSRCRLPGRGVRTTGRRAVTRPDGYLVGRLTVDQIVQEVARGFDVTVEDLRGYSRARELVVARDCAMAVVRQGTTLSFPAIGRVFGGRDHTTVMHAVRKVLGDPVLAESVRLVVEELSPPPRLFAVPDEEAV